MKTRKQSNIKHLEMSNEMKLVDRVKDKIEETKSLFSSSNLSLSSLLEINTQISKLQECMKNITSLKINSLMNLIPSDVWNHIFSFIQTSNIYFWIDLLSVTKLWKELIFDF